MPTCGLLGASQVVMREHSGAEQVASSEVQVLAWPCLLILGHMPSGCCPVCRQETWGGAWSQVGWCHQIVVGFTLWAAGEASAGLC